MTPTLTHSFARTPSTAARLGALLIACLGCRGASAPAASRAEARDGASDFDFILGRWTIKNRVLVKSNGGASSWYEFDATSVNVPIWGGAANIEEWDGMGRSGRIQGLAVRLYDPATRQWRIYWADRRQGTLGYPVVGSFAGARGVFFADGTLDGKPTRERVIWSRIAPDACRWEQAMSLDGGATWETNWVMDFTRAAPAAAPAR